MSANQHRATKADLYQSLLRVTQERADLEAALKRVEALHTPQPGSWCCIDHEGNTPYPCPTITAVRGDRS